MTIITQRDKLEKFFHRYDIQCTYNGNKYILKATTINGESTIAKVDTEGEVYAYMFGYGQL